MSPRILGAVLAIVLLGGGSVAFVMWRAGSAEDETRTALLAEAELELGRPDAQRADLTRLLSRVDAGTAATERPHPDLVRMKARIQLALGRAAKAWETIGPVATTPGARPEDVWVAARVAARRYAESASERLGRQALGLARDAAQAMQSPEAAFLAWQVAYRLDAGQDWVELSRDLLAAHPGSLEADTVDALRHFLALHMLQRRGVALDIPALEKLRDDARASADDRALSGEALDTMEAFKAVDVALVRSLENRWGIHSTPPELLVLVARGELARGEQAQDRGRIGEAVDILRGVLEDVPTFIEARHLLALAHYGLGETESQRAHLRWLLEHAPKDDVRRTLWQTQLR